MNKHLFEELNQLLTEFTQEEFTQEPNYFETQSEREMNLQTEKEIDDLYKQDEKKRNKYVNIIAGILKNNKLDYQFNKQAKIFTVYFPTKYQYNSFMAKEKNSKRLNTSLRKDLDNTYFEKLPKDSFHTRYITLWSK